MEPDQKVWNTLWKYQNSLCGPEEWKKPWFLYLTIKKCLWYYDDHFCKLHADKNPDAVYKCLGLTVPSCDKLAEELVKRFPRLSALGDIEKAKEQYAVAMRNVLRCGAVLVDICSNKILLVQDVKGSYTFPRGKVKKNEKAIDCMYRELKEELDIDLHKCKIIASKEFLQQNERINFKLYAFIGYFGGEKITLDPKELRSYKWVTFDEIREHPTYDIAAFLPSLKIFINETSKSSKLLTAGIGELGATARGAQREQSTTPAVSQKPISCFKLKLDPKPYIAAQAGNLAFKFNYPLLISKYS